MTHRRATIHYTCPESDKVVEAPIQNLQIGTETFDTGIGEYEDHFIYIECADCKKEHRIDDKGVLTTPENSSNM